MIEKSILLEKAMKLYNLIASDNSHESQRASEALEKFLIKHHLSLEEVIDNELVFFEFEQENKYEVYLFNHLLVCTIQDSPDLVKKCGIKMLTENKMGYKLTKYVKESLFFKYQRVLKVYIESREELKIHISEENVKKMNSPLSDVITFTFMGELMELETPRIKPEFMQFEEEHFFISFIRKYKLIPKRNDEKQSDAKTLSQEEIANIMKMEKMYSKKNVENFELDGGNKIGPEIC